MADLPKDGATSKPNSIIGQAYGNILDQYDNPTYNLKLYMIGPTENASTEGSNKNDTPDADREDVDTSNKDVKRGGFMNGAFKASKDNTIVLCQTGVTGSSIESCEIKSVPSGSGSNINFEVDMRIEQPGAANFLDQILLAKRRLGIPEHDSSVPFFLEINFQGYKESNLDESDWNVDEGGHIQHIAGPYIYRLILNTATIEVTYQGSAYNFNFAAMEDKIVNSAKIARIQESITTTGDTITKHIEDLQKQLNEYLKRPVDSGEADSSDTYTFDLSGLVGGKFIKDETLDTSDLKEESTQTNKTEEEVAKAETTQGAVEAGQDKKSGSGTEEPVGESITFAADTKIEEAIKTILARNKDYVEAVKPYEVPKDQKEKADANSRKEETAMFVMKHDVKYIEYDKKRRAYEKEFILKPRVVATQTTATTNVQVSQEEMEAGKIQAIIEKMKIKKAYEYIFTGRNDQILNIDIKYDLGQALILPPKDAEGHDFGDAALNNPAYFQSEPKPDDEALDPISDLANFIGNIKSLAQAFKNLKEDPLRELGKLAGLDTGQIKELVADRAGAVARGLISSLSDRQINQALDGIKAFKKGSKGQQNVFTSSDRQTLIDENSYGEYTADVSGYQYGEDLLGLDGTTVFLDDLSGKEAREKIQENIQNEQSKQHNGPAMPHIETEVMQDQSSLSARTPANNLLGYMFAQRRAMDILLNLQISLRGDPWYLGDTYAGTGTNPHQSSDSDDPESSEVAINSTGDNFFLFELRQPEYFDPNVDNEDENTGLWPIGGNNYFISGIYRILQVTNEFSQGQMRTYVDSAKELPLDLSKIDKNSSLDEIEKYAEYWNSANDGVSEGLDGRRMNDDGTWTSKPKSPEDIHRTVGVGVGQGMDEDWWKTYPGYTSEEKAAYEAWLKERSGNG